LQANPGAKFSVSWEEVILTGFSNYLERKKEETTWQTKEPIKQLAQ